MDIKELCRFCLKKPVGKSYAPEAKLKKLIEKYLDIEFHEDLSFPANICNSCLLRLKDFHLLYKEAHKSQERLRAFAKIEEEEREAEDFKKLEDFGIETTTFDDNEELTESKFDIKAVEYLEAEYVLDVEQNYEIDGQNGDEAAQIPSAEVARIVKIHRAKPRQPCGADGNTEVVCPSCGQMILKRKLGRHIRRYHSAAKIQCEFCEKVFTDPCRYQSHKNYHENSIPCVCNECGKIFQHEKTLKIHMKSHLPKVECDICGKLLVNERKLRIHKKRIHTPHAQRPHKCTFCKRSFWDKDEWIDHTATHTGNYCRECMFCGSQLRNMPNLYVHLKSRHPTEYAEYLKKKEDDRVAKVKASVQIVKKARKMSEL